MYSSSVFAEVDLFALKFYLDRVVPYQLSWHQKTIDSALPDSEDRITLHSIVLTQCRSVTDRRTNGQTDVSYTSLAKLAFRRAVKTRNSTTAELARDADDVKRPFKVTQGYPFLCELTRHICAFMASLKAPPRPKCPTTSSKYLMLWYIESRVISAWRP